MIMKKSFTLFLIGILVIIMTIPSAASYYPGIEGGIIDGGTLTDGEIIQFIWELYGVVPEDVSQNPNDATTLFAELGILTAINPAWWVNARKGYIDLEDSNAKALKNYALSRYMTGGVSYYADLIQLGYRGKFYYSSYQYYQGYGETIIIAYKMTNGNSVVSAFSNQTSNKYLDFYNGTSSLSWEATRLGNDIYQFGTTSYPVSQFTNVLPSVAEARAIAQQYFAGTLQPVTIPGAVNKGSFGNVLDRKKEGELRDADPVIIGEFGNTVIDIQPEKARELVNGAISGTISNADVLAQTGTIPLVMEQDKYYPLTNVGVSDVPYEFPDVPASGFTLSGLEELFPFCIPFDIYDMLSVLAAEPEAPKFTWVLPFNGNNYEYEVDLSQFDTVAEVARTAMILCFCLWLAIKTRDLIRG